jgi:hypothetical protein
MKKNLPLWHLAQNTLKAYKQAGLTQYKRRQLELELKKKKKKVEQYKTLLKN